MIIDCIGCLHGAKPKLKGGDLLIITGDLTANHSIWEHSDILDWLHKQKYKKKVLVAGNHDDFLEKNPNFYSKTNIDYLCDSGTEFEYWETPYPPMRSCELRKIKIWGSPWTASFPGINPNCQAFTMPFGFDNEYHLNEMWDLIPHDTDILVTHSPPYDFFDKTKGGELVGSKTLLAKMMEIKPKLHAFSHIHEQGGNIMLLKHLGPNTWVVNCSIMNEKYKPVNKPMRIIL